MPKLSPWVLGLVGGTFFVGYGAGCTTSTVVIDGDVDSGTEPRVDGGGTGDSGASELDSGGDLVDNVLACMDSPQRIPYQAPIAAAGACSTEQMEAYANCFLDGDRDTCDAFLDDEANEGCLDGCLIAFGPTESNYGPVLLLGDGFFNEAGYFALEGVSSNCVDETWNEFSCVAFVCDACIDDPNPRVYDRCLEFARGTDPRNQCLERVSARNAACAGEQAKVDTLRQDLTTRAGLAKMFSAFCGN